MTDDPDFGTQERVLPQGIYTGNYESSIAYHSKAMANVDKQTDGQTDGHAKNYMPPPPPIYPWGRIKRRLLAMLQYFLLFPHLFLPYKDINCHKHFNLVQSKILTAGKEFTIK